MPAQGRHHNLLQRLHTYHAVLMQQHALCRYMRCTCCASTAEQPTVAIQQLYDGCLGSQCTPQQSNQADEMPCPQQNHNLTRHLRTAAETSRSPRKEQSLAASTAALAVPGGNAATIIMPCAATCSDVNYHKTREPQGSSHCSSSSSSSCLAVA